MHPDESRARIGHRGNAISRAKHLALKVLIVLCGAVVLASAFVLSVVFVAIALAAFVVVGGYLWWQTRELRRQIRARMQERPLDGEVIEGEVIEGEVISRERTPR